MTNALAVPILEALVTHFDLVKLVQEHFERTEDVGDVVRKGHVAEKLAKVLDVFVSSPFRVRVARAVRDAGWSRAKLKEGYWYYVRMKAK